MIPQLSHSKVVNYIYIQYICKYSTCEIFVKYRAHNCIIIVIFPSWKLMSNPVEIYGKSVHTEFKLQLCKEYLKQTCLQPTNKLHSWEYCASLYMVCIVLSGGRSLSKISDFSEFVADSETTRRDPYMYCEPIPWAPMNLDAIFYCMFITHES